MRLRTSLALSLALIVAVLAGSHASAQTEYGDAVTVSATVELIDLKARTLVLKTKDGQIATMVVPDTIANLDKVKVGDTITTTYMQGVAAEILKPGDEPAPVSASAQKQGGGKVISANQTSKVLKVKSVDLATNSVTFTGEDGTRTIKVKRPELQEKLKTLKPGDDVQITFTEAMAIKVEPKAVEK